MAVEGRQSSGVGGFLEEWGKEAPPTACKSSLGKGEEAAFCKNAEGLRDWLEVAFAQQTRFLFRLSVHKGWLTED